MKYFLGFLFLLIAPAASAQVTAQPLQPGSLTTSGCPGANTPCFVPYSSVNPLPISVIGGSGDTSGFVLTSTGPGTAATFQAPAAAPGVNTASTITQVACSVSGNAFFTQPFSGASYKEVTIRLATCTGTASYTYPTAFTNTPDIVVTSAFVANIITTDTTTSVTISGSTTSGFAFLKGN